jgi:selenocysteine lyase/cysteine desulfurase
MQQVDPDEARHLFPLTEHYIHMNHAGVAPMSERVRAAIEQVIDGSMNAPYRHHWAQDEADRVRGLMAQLVNAPDDFISLTRSTGHGLSLLAQGLDWKPQDNVVGAMGEYPANVYPWMALGSRGIEFRQAKPVAGRVTAESVFNLVDSHTRVVALSHVAFWNGYRIDIDAIGGECRKRGIVFAVDVMQSVGALRVDVGRMPIDFCAAGAGKWLMGPPGIGFCYCSPALVERIQPTVVGARSVVGDERYFDYDLTFKPDARRFEESVVSLLDVAAFGAAIELLLDVGPAVVEQRVLQLAGRLAANLASNGYEIVEPWPRDKHESSGIVSFRRKGATAQALLRDLNAAHVIARTHRDFVRLSPHFYNTDEEVDRVLDVLVPERVSQ